MLQIILLVAFFACFGFIAYQEIKYRRIQHYLILLLAVIAVIHVGVVSDNPLGLFLFLGMVTAMLGVVKLGGMYKTSDWLCISACFAFLIPFGIHIAVWAVLLGFTVSVFNHVVVCLISNVRRSPFPDVTATKGTKLLAMISCKRRGIFDRFAYPAVIMSDGVLVFDINSGMKGKKMDYSRKCPYVIPSIPIISYMCAMTLVVVFLLFPQNIISWMVLGI